MRHQFKSRLLALTEKKVRAAAEKYFGENFKNHAVAVISGEDQLRAANQELADSPLELHRI